MKKTPTLTQYFSQQRTMLQKAYESINNPYVDINGVDRSEEIDLMYMPTLEDIKNDPSFYAELVNDLMYHWVYGTRETPMMVQAKKAMLGKKAN